MLKEGMGLPRNPTPFLVLSLVLALFAGCAKSGAPASGSPADRPNSSKGDGAGGCDAAIVDAALAGIARDETAKNTLEKSAKDVPEKSNFRKLYDAEIAFASSAESQLTRLTSCGAAPAALAEIKNKVAKARANVTYLSESFPDFK